MNRIRTSCAALALVALAAGCGSQANSGPAPAPTPSVTVTVTVPSSIDATTATSAAAPMPTSTATATALARSSSSPKPAATSSVVDPAAFAATGGSGQGYYFRTGALRCGIGEAISGCQSTEPVASAPTCNDPKTLAPFIMMGGTEPGGPCTTQGVFIIQDAKELRAGQTLKAKGITCTVIASGSVECSGPDGRIVANSRVFSYSAS